MKKRTINWKALIVLVLFTAILLVTVFSLRLWRKTMTAKNSLQTGQQAYEDLQWRQAVKEFGRYLAANPQDIPILHKYAEARLKIRPLKQEDIQQTIAAYRSILRLERTNLQAVENLTNLYLQLEVASEAELVTRDFLKTADDPQITVLLAMALVKQQKFEEAGVLLLNLIKQHPDNVPAYELLAGIAELHPELLPEMAEEWHHKAVSNNPLSASALITRASFYRRHNQLEDAVKDLQKAEQLDLSSTDTHLQLASEFASLNRFEKARMHIKQLLSENSGNLRLWQTWANIALLTDSEEEMRSVAINGLEALKPDIWDFVPIAGELLIRSGDYDLAAEWIQKLHEQEFDPVVVYKLRGLLSEGRKDYYAAVKYWTQAYQAGDKSETTYLALGRAYKNAGDIQSSEQWLRQLISQQPDSVQGHVDLSGLLLQIGQWDEAARLARRAERLAPGHVDAVLLRIRAQINAAEALPPEQRNAQMDRLIKELDELEKSSADPFPVSLVQLQLAIRREQFEKAEQYLNILQAEKPDSVELGLAEADLLIARDNITEAAAKLEALTEQHPQHVLAIKTFASLLADQNRTAECESLLVNSIQKVEDPAAKRYLLFSAVKLINQWHQHDKARQLLADLSNQMPDDIPLKRERLRYSRSDNNPDAAQQLIDQIKNLEGPNGWQWRYEQASLWFTAGNFTTMYPQIITLLKENLNFNPSDQQSRMLLAATYEKIGNLQLALATCREALSYSPENIQVILPAVSIMYRAEEYKAAEEILDRIAERKLFHPFIARLELEGHLGQGNLQSAETLISEMYFNDPNNTELCLSLAMLQIRLEKYNDALYLLRGLRTVQPDSIPVAAVLAELNIHQDKFTEAVQLCDEMIDQHGTAATYILRGQTYQAIGREESAQKDFEQAVITEPDNIQAWLAKSEFSRATGRYEQAVADLEKAMTLAPDSTLIQKRLLALWLSSERPDIERAERLLAKARLSAPSDTELQLFEARCLLLKKSLASTEKARQMLLEITEKKPKTAYAWVLLTDIYLNRNMNAEAMETVLQGLAYLPEDSRLLLMKARTEARHSSAAALPTLKQLYEQEPQSVEIILELAKTYADTRKYEESIRLLQDYINKNPDRNNLQANIQLAVTLYQKGDIEKAEQKFDLLREKAPFEPALLSAQAQMLLEDRQWDALKQRLDDAFEQNALDADLAEIIINKLFGAASTPALEIAEELIDKMLTRQPGSPAMNKALAILYQIKGMSSECAEIYARILESNPDDPVAINNLAWIFCEEQGDYQKALKLAQTGLQKTPDYADLLDTRGVIYYRMTQYQHAVRDFSKCVELYPENSASMQVAQFHLARALAAMGQTEKAIDNLMHCLDAGEKLGGLSGAEIDEARALLENLLQQRGQANNAYRRSKI